MFDDKVLTVCTLADWQTSEGLRSRTYDRKLIPNLYVEFIVTTPALLCASFKEATASWDVLKKHQLRK